MARHDDREVAAVEGRHALDTDSFGDRDDGRVGGAETQVGVPLDQLGHTSQVIRHELGQPQTVLVVEGTEELRFGTSIAVSLTMR